MHHIYHTEGIILGSKNFGEADRYYSVFTRDLGMIHASAQGVRKMSSKLRFILQDFSYVKVDLVQGKNFWRVTSASKAGRLERLMKNPAKLAIFAEVARLLARLLPATERNDALFVELLDGLTLLERTETKENLPNIEAVIVLRALAVLGSIGENAALDNLLKLPFQDELLAQVSARRPLVLRHINQALRESHL